MDKLKIFVEDFIDKEKVNPNDLMKMLFKIINDKIDRNKTKNILYNNCFGGFQFSDEFLNFVGSNYEPNKKENDMYNVIIDFGIYNKISEEISLKRASGKYSNLAVAKVPSHLKYTINEHDGCESVNFVKESDLNFFS
jgi:hypothetical protein